jgi:hypothetical protein
MPDGFDTPVLSTVTMVSNSATFAGSGFADFQFPLAGGCVWLSADGGTTKVYPDSYQSWADDTVVAHFSGADYGSYTSAGAVSGSGEASNVLSGTWDIVQQAAGTVFFFNTSKAAYA